MSENPMFDGRDGGPATPDAPLAARVEQYGDAPDECTIFPTDVDEHELVTRWVTAREGAYVDLAGMR